MTNIETKKIIKKIISKWSYIVTDYGWRFNVYYCVNGHVMPSGNEHASAFTKWHSEYLQGDIYFNLFLLSDCDEKFIEECVVHEITHLLLGALSTENSQHNVELTTTMVSRLFIGLRNAK